MLGDGTYTLLDHGTSLDVVRELGLESVPQFNTLMLDHTVDEFVAFAERTCVLNPKAEREGVVLRPLEEEYDENFGGPLRFKVIIPRFLLKDDG